jgi:hypothetical protein
MRPSPTATRRARILRELHAAAVALKVVLLLVSAAALVDVSVARGTFTHPGPQRVHAPKLEPGRALIAVPAPVPDPFGTQTSE